jgi:hypothetical protein
MVDFNDVSDGIVTGLASTLTGAARPLSGDRVLLHDDGQHEMWATVTRVHKGLVDAAVEWATWRQAQREPVRLAQVKVPRLTVDILRTFSPPPIPAVTHALPLQWGARFGESSNVSAQAAQR